MIHTDKLCVSESWSTLRTLSFFSNSIPTQLLSLLSLKNNTIFFVSRDYFEYQILHIYTYTHTYHKVARDVRGVRNNVYSFIFNESWSEKIVSICKINQKHWIIGACDIPHWPRTTYRLSPLLLCSGTHSMEIGEVVPQWCDFIIANDLWLQRLLKCHKVSY